MARYEHLPIYKSALDLTVHFEKLVAGFSRYHKYTLGTELREGSRAVLMQVLRANQARNAPERCAELLVLRDRIDALLMSVRVVLMRSPLNNGNTPDAVTRNACAQADECRLSGDLFIGRYFCNGRLCEFT